MTKHVKLLKGEDNLSYVRNSIITGLKYGDMSIGFDIDGTLGHDLPGVHEVEHDPRLTDLLNTYHECLKKDVKSQTDDPSSQGEKSNSFVLTGRPDKFIQCKFGDERLFLAGSEHGGVISVRPGSELIYRAGNVADIQSFKDGFNEMAKNNPYLKLVGIEDHKEVTATLGFTSVFNPLGLTELSTESLDLMQRIAESNLKAARDVVQERGLKLNVDDTITLTNAVIEIRPDGIEKEDSLKWLRDHGLVDRKSTNVFCGDSSGDAAVMRMIFHEKGGICLGVGQSAPNESHVVFERPENLVGFLKECRQMALG